MITPPSFTDEDPDMAQRDEPAAGFELQLADDAGMDQHNGTVERGETGGVPSANFQDHLASFHDQTADPTHSEELGGHVAGDHGGASQDTGDTGSAGRDSGGDMAAEPYEIGGASDENRGADGDIGGDESESGDRPESESHQGNISTGRPAGARVLEFFRRGGTDIALMGRESLQPVGESYGSVYNITVREAIRTRGEEAERVIMKELNQMITKRVWTPIDGKRLTAEERSRVIRSSMFLKEKYLASGEFEKLKARLVAGGDQQDKLMYDDLSAPTVSTSSVFSILSIAAHKGRKAAVVDIGGAFLNAEMKTGVAVHKRLDRTMSELVTRLQPSYEKYQDGKGCIIVRLDRALYGCVESAALWYENLRDTMTALGYETNPHDICVFNKKNEEVHSAPSLFMLTTY
jgi:Reverse transcriptase (RNA-dependent DNA polymerase)